MFKNIISDSLIAIIYQINLQTLLNFEYVLCENKSCYQIWYPGKILNLEILNKLWTKIIKTPIILNSLCILNKEILVRHQKSVINKKISLHHLKLYLL